TDPDLVGPVPGQGERLVRVPHGGSPAGGAAAAAGHDLLAGGRGPGARNALPRAEVEAGLADGSGLGAVPRAGREAGRASRDLAEGAAGGESGRLGGRHAGPGAAVPSLAVPARRGGRGDREAVRRTRPLEA